jgi:hypothetical protein
MNWIGLDQQVNTKPIVGFRNNYNNNKGRETRLQLAIIQKKSVILLDA